MGKLKLYSVCFYMFAGAFGLVWAVYYHEYIRLAIWSVFWLIIMAVEIMEVKLIADISGHYDFLFMNRKNPAVYQTVKAHCEETFEEQGKMRRTMLGFQVGLIAFQIFFVPLIIPIALFGIFRLYLPSIFDFDEPDLKKPAKWEVSDMVKKTLDRLSEAVKPNPAPQPI